MRYVLLLYATGDEPASSCDEASSRTSIRALVAELARAGQHQASLGLAGTGSATTVRLRGGRMLLCDGPVTESGERLHGLIVIDVRDLDEAIAVAARVPDACSGAVEIRPLRETT
jgi:hypothetical protein